MRRRDDGRALIEKRAHVARRGERVTLYDLKMDAPSATQRADGRWDVTVPVAAKKFYVTEEGVETETPLAERIEVGLFTAEPGGDAFHQSDVILMERQPIRSGTQVLKFLTGKRPAFAGVDPYNFTSTGTPRITCCRSLRRRGRAPATAGSVRSR